MTVSTTQVVDLRRKAESTDHFAPVLGTQNGHKELWIQHACFEAADQDRLAEPANQSMRQQDLEEKLNARKEALETARAVRVVQPRTILSKGEFETTAEFDQRCMTMQKTEASAAARLEQTAAAELDQANKALKEFQESRRGSLSTMKKRDVMITPSRRVMVLMTMDQYNADLQRIPRFTADNPHKVGEVSSVSQLFEFNGAICGITVDRIWELGAIGWTVSYAFHVTHFLPFPEPPNSVNLSSLPFGVESLYQSHHFAGPS